MDRLPLPRATLALLVLSVGGCATFGASGDAQERPPPLAVFEPTTPPPDPKPRPGGPPVLIRGATVMTATGAVWKSGHVLLSGGKIAAVGEGEGQLPEGVEVVDGKGLFVTPGVIDAHSHMGVYAYPAAVAHQDGNEMTGPATPHVWAEHGFWPQDPALWRALAGGVTTVQVLPGSANLIGGRSFTIKLRPALSARLMRIPGAPQGLKMACGENPKRVYGSEKQAPMTRMGNVAAFRIAFQKAREYRRTQQKYQRDLAAWQKRQQDPEAAEGKDPTLPDDPPEPPARDFGLETLAEVLEGKLLVHNHCYRADEMALMLDLAKEYGFQIRSFHHALEAYKLADRLAQEGVAVSTWEDWWGFKMEAFDGIPENAAMVTKAGARVVIHSDSAVEVRRLNLEAAKAMTFGRRAGIPITEDQALRWITANAAWVLGIQDRTGTLEPGKDADLVVWSGNPFSIYSLPLRVYVDGELLFDRAKGPRLSDFELGGADLTGELP